jgi:hypothetical protein
MAADRLFALEDIAPLTPHQPWHDLESFFWVLLFIVTRYTDNPWKSTDQKKMKIVELFDGPSAVTKRDFLRNPRRFQHPNPPLQKCIEDFASELSGSYPVQSRRLAPQTPNPPTHESILSVLDDALESSDWPENDGPVGWVPPLVKGGVPVRQSAGIKRKRDDGHVSSGRKGRAASAGSERER